jgi:hypothetical protein
MEGIVMSIEAMKQALEALGWTDEWRPQGLKEKAITALRTAIAEAEKQEQKPVGQLQDAQPLRGAMPWEQLYPQFGDATPPAAQPCPYIRSTAEGTHHCALANQTKEQL